MTRLTESQIAGLRLAAKAATVLDGDSPRAILRKAEFANQANPAVLTALLDEREALREALDSALHLASVPEHAQDDEWQQEYNRLQALGGTP